MRIQKKFVYLFVWSFFVTLLVASNVPKMNAKGSFRISKWDFGLRVYQIGAVLTTYYAILGTIFLIFGYLWRVSPSMELIFNTDVC